MSLKLATWNINSVRLRIGLVERFLDEEQPDVLCLQETKTQDEFFPAEAFAARRYAHQHVHGMKSYNGVAIVSRVPFVGAKRHHWQGREDCRHISVTLPDQIDLHCCYVPAGGDIPDPEGNPKFAHKLGFLDEQAAWWKKEKKQEEERGEAARKILVGDFNVAPLENDVWSHRQMLSVVSHTPVEVDKLRAWQDSYEWQDAVRAFAPIEQKLYSWWSYRAKDWQASDRGRRLDHVWITPSLKPSLRNARILRDARGWSPKPSDHVPVIVELG